MQLDSRAASPDVVDDFWRKPFELSRVVDNNCCGPASKFFVFPKFPPPLSSQHHLSGSSYHRRCLHMWWLVRDYGAALLNSCSVPEALLIYDFVSCNLKRHQLLVKTPIRWGNLDVCMVHHRSLRNDVCVSVPSSHCTWVVSHKSLHLWTFRNS